LFSILVWHCEAAGAAIHAGVNTPTDKTQEHHHQNGHGPRQDGCRPTRFDGPKLNRHVVLAKLFDQPLANHVAGNHRLKRYTLLALNCQGVAFNQKRSSRAGLRNLIKLRVVDAGSLWRARLVDDDGCTSD
jgi:hypothetical protein